jgi:hypothetical protein
MKNLKVIIIIISLCSVISCSLPEKSHYKKFQKVHKNVKDNSKY